MNELNEHGDGYEQYCQDIISRAKAEWMEETNGDITFDQWLDGELEDNDEEV